MKKNINLFLLISLLLGGCRARGTKGPPIPDPTIDLEKLVSAALLETQQAQETAFSPAPPYSPLELAALLVPGDLLEGEWQPSTVYDLTQPYPPLADFCGEYYNGCAEIFENNVATYGVELEMLHEGNQLGEVALLYYKDPSLPDSLFQYVQDNWSGTDLDDTSNANELWMHRYSPFQREVLGERWMHRVGYSLFEWEGPEADTTYDRPEREFNQIEIIFIRCHVYLELDLRFPVENPWDSPEDNLEARAAEQEARFNLVYEYAQALDERITSFACGP